jgi:hypothetical protein
MTEGSMDFAVMEGVGWVTFAIIGGYMAAIFWMGRND